MLRILLVEDNEHDAIAFRRAMERSSVASTVTCCLRAEEALARLEAGSDAFDLVVTDHGLPGMSGLDFCRTVLDKGATWPVVMMTGTGSEGLAVEALKAGVDDYLIKDTAQAYLALLPVVLPEVVRRREDRLARQRTEAIEESLRFLQSTLDALSAYIAILDDGGTIIAVNGVWAQRAADTGFLGGGCGEGDNYLAVCDAAAAENPAAAAAAAGIREVFAGRRDLLYLEYASHGAAGERWFALRATRFAAPGPVRVVVAHEEITERKRAEAERALLAAAVEQAAEMILITDAEGVIEYVNPAFEQITGYSRDEAVGQNPRMLKSDKHDAAFFADLWATLKRGDVWTGHFTNTRKDGTLYEEDAVISAVRDEAGRIARFVKVMRDVTQERKLEAQLQQAQRLEAIGTLAGGIAHDFNNILTAVLGYAELALESGATADTLHNYVRHIITGAERARDVVNQILTFSRQGEGPTPQPLDLVPLVRETLRLVRAGLPASIEIQEDVAPNVPTVTADPTQIHQVLMNLCTNAAHAMENRGEIIVTLQPMTLDAQFCAVHETLQPGPHLLLSVEDTGSGMDTDTVSRIFEPFYTTKGVGEGTGLGLAVVHGIVKSLRGDITVYSEPGAGSTFHVYLPASQLRAERVPELEAEVAGGDEAILIIDDEPQVRELCRESLEARGYAVTVCFGGIQALELVRERGAPFDLIVTDQTMPEMSGTELAARIREMRPGQRIILSTGFKNTATIRAAAEAGVTEVLSKPLTPRMLCSAVRRVLDAPAPPGSGEE